MNLKSFLEGGIPRKAEMTRFEMIRIPDAVILIRYDSVRSYSKELFRNNLYRLRRIFFREHPRKIPRIAGYVRDFPRVLSGEKTSRMYKLFLNSS